MSDVIKIVVNETAIAKTMATQIPLQTAPTEAADMSATGATDGHALVADGAGGAAWEAVANSVAGRTGAVTIASADISDATDDSVTNPEKVLKTDTSGSVKVSELTASAVVSPVQTTDRLAFGPGSLSLSLGNVAVAAFDATGLPATYVSGLGSAALLEVGTSTGTVAAGDHTHSTYIPLTGSQAITGALGLSGTGPINAQTDGYTLVAADNGKIVTLNKGTALTVTVPASLGASFSCMLIQLGAGQVTVAASGTTINSYGTALKLSGQHAAATLVAYAADTFNLAGNLTA